MKIFEFDQNRYAKIKVNNRLDLWHLQNIIEPKDLIKAKTLRTIFIQREDKREKLKKKKLVTLTIKVEKIDFHKYKNKLRITGKIVEAPKEISLGEYHTVEVGLGSILTIEKKWKKEQIERLEKAKIKIKGASPKTIQEFFMHVNKADGLAAYGLDNIKLVSISGAVKVLLVPEEKIQEKEVGKLMKEVENRRGEIKLISKKEEIGKKFCRTYDIAAILRFPIS
jgi:stalled ribosome rescue protein Dom34